MPDILVRVEKGIQKIIFNRPDQKNAFTKNVYRDLPLALSAAEDDDSVLATVLTGAGRFYSSGNDFRGSVNNVSEDVSIDEAVKESCMAVQRFVSSLIDYPKPLIAIVNGPAIGIAATTLGLCDMVFTTEKASQVLYFGHKLTAQEGKECGFVNDIIKDFDPSTVFSRLQDHLSKSSLESMRSIKKLLRKVDGPYLHAANIAECEEIEKRLVSDDFFNRVQTIMTSKL